MPHPPTIYNPNEFDKSNRVLICPHCGKPFMYDGIFDWQWMLNALGYPRLTRIHPMDVDCMIERFYHYLIFETKNEGAKFLKAQLQALHGLRQMKTLTVVEMHGKDDPKDFAVTYYKRDGTPIKRKGFGLAKITEYVKKWFRAANKDTL